MRPKRRIIEHIARSNKKNHCANWVRALLAKGLKPKLEILAQVTELTWKQDEIDYIAAFRSMGCDLVNATTGGDSGPSMPGEKNPNFGQKHSPEARKKMGHSGEKHPFFGKKHGLETLAKMSAVKTGKKFSPETCAKMSASRLGKIPWNKGLKNGIQ